MIYRITAATALCATLLSAQSTPPESKDSMKELQQHAIEQLAAVGYKVPDDIKLERRTPRQVREDFASVQKEEDLNGLFWLFRSLNIKAGRNTKVLNKAIIRASSLGLSAYYHAPRKSFVILDTPIRELTEALSGSLGPLFVHELVHANQDARKTGILAVFGAAQTTDHRPTNRTPLCARG